MHEQLPPVSPPSARWYPDPGDRGHVRFWDGHAWTGQVAAASPPAVPLPPEAQLGSSSPRSSFGCMFYAAVVLVLLTVILGVFGFAVRRGLSDSGAEAAVSSSCEYFVRARMQDPASAKFVSVQATPPVSGDVWVVTGVVSSRTAAGPRRRQGFTCTVAPQAGGWRLVALRFTGS